MSHGVSQWGAKATAAGPAWGLPGSVRVYILCKNSVMILLMSFGRSAGVTQRALGNRYSAPLSISNSTSETCFCCIQQLVTDM